MLKLGILLFVSELAQKVKIVKNFEKKKKKNLEALSEKNLSNKFIKNSLTFLIGALPVAAYRP